MSKKIKQLERKRNKQRKSPKTKRINDVVLMKAKAEIQNRSRWLVASGRRSPESLCLFSAADVKACTITFPDFPDDEKEPNQMMMTDEDLAFMKGAGSVQTGDTETEALTRAEENGYLAPGARRDAFILGFVDEVKRRNK